MQGYMELSYLLLNYDLSYVNNGLQRYSKIWQDCMIKNEGIAPKLKLA